MNICIWNQIEHAQHLAPGSANRFGKHGIIASVQVNYSVPMLLYIGIMLYKADCELKSSASEFLLKIFQF
jgi:predicted amidohydrolase YtcJ